jgi:mannose-6-phosphate isomerase-like protein (cupin superfamily)
MKDNTSDFTYPEFHSKGWGFELWIVNGEKYCGKILHFNKDKRCSFHYHKLKSEHFYVQKGSFILKLRWGDDDYENAVERLINVGQVIEIPVGLRHQMISREDSDIIEISTHHFEDDSYRIIKGD